MNHKKASILSVLAIFIVTNAPVLAIGVNQTDNFQNGTLNSWSSGSRNPNPPVTISTGGPLGVGDQYMRLTSTGTSGAGSKLVVFNTSQWAGNYVSAGVNTIRMHLKNEGSTTLHIKLVLTSSGDFCSSKNDIVLPANSGWVTASFPVDAQNLSGSSVAAVLSNVTELRLLHQTSSGTSGDVITAQLGVDNITALSGVSDVESMSSDVPKNFALSQNYPNPFNPVTSIDFSLAKDSRVSLKVYTILGNQVATLADGYFQAGVRHRVQFDASQLSSGMYLYRMSDGTNALTRRLILLK